MISRDGAFRPHLTQHIFPLKHNQTSQQKTDAVHPAAASATKQLVCQESALNTSCEVIAHPADHAAMRLVPLALFRV